MTLREVAKLAGVSPSAVSRYLNGGSLSAEKSAVIRRVIEKTGYYPDQAAHTLRTGRVRQIGVIVPRIHSETVSQVTAGITAVLSGCGYLPVLGSTEGVQNQEGRYLEMMRAYHVAGVILMAASMSDRLISVCRTYATPLVITGQRVPGFHCVYHDDFNAMRELTGRLLARGRRKLCYIGVSEEDVAVGRERLRGARCALREAGMNTMPILTATFDWESGRTCMRRLLETYPDTDGVLCATDAIAHGAMAALRDAGRRVPEDVSVAGVGNDWANLVSTPRLTTARLRHGECGIQAASILLRLIEQPAAPPRQIMLSYTIVDRDSV